MSDSNNVSDGQIDRLVDWWIGGRTDGWMDRQMDRWRDRWIDRHTDIQWDFLIFLFATKNER